MEVKCNIREILKDTLKDLRIENELTQFELAEKLQIGQATIAGYESGAREPRIEILISYADFFQCSIDYLVGREDEFGNILIPASKEKNIPSLTIKEQNLLSLFSILSPEMQSQLLGYAQGLAETVKLKKKIR